MLAAVYESTGPAGVLRVEEIPTPDPRPGEVRVRLAVSGVNPTDWKSRSAGSVDRAFQIPNQDGAGVIDAVGEGVDARRIGQRVWVYFAAWKRPWGTAAQWTVLPAAQAVALPDGISFELGASLGIPALTAHRCLFADGPLAGRAVLVAGGAGAVGHAAIELGRWASARVVASVSTDEKADLARAAGADATVNYRDADAADQILRRLDGGVDRVVEVALGANLELDLQVCGPNAAISSYATEPAGEVSVPVRRLMSPNIVLRFVLVYTMPAGALHAAIADVTAALEAGALTTLPIHRFPLEEVAAAHDAVERGVTGKVLIDLP
ncbi:MAG TPA: NADPH:quinone reductase [Solirubrobacteraceae bacterium]